MPKLDEQTQRARREHILDAAERRFACEGFHRSSMQDICREASISPGALYLYFTSKEDLIAGICERERTHFAHALSSVAEAPDFMAALSQLAQAYCVDEPEEKLRLHLEINAEALRNPAIGKTVREIDAFVVEQLPAPSRRRQGEGTHRSGYRLRNGRADPLHSRRRHFSEARHRPGIRRESLPAGGPFNHVLFDQAGRSRASEQ